MVSDRLKAAITQIVESILAERAEIDHHALYAAKVVSQSGQTLTVQFDDERLRSKSAVPLCPAPGQVPTVAAGTRVLVGWTSADPSKPYIAGVWLGDGGLVSCDETFSQSRRFIGPLTEVKAASATPVKQVALKGDNVTSTAEFVTWATAVKAQIMVAGGGDVGLPPTVVGAISGPCAANLKAS